MRFVRETRLLVLALFFVSLAGFLMHLRTHLPAFRPDGATNPANWVPFIFGLMSVLAAPFLLSHARTVIVGFLLNGISVIIGAILMATMSLYHMPDPLTFGSLFLNTALSLIVLLFVKLLIGQQIFLHHHPRGMGRMFTAWWWTRHFVYLGAVFTIGHFIWR